MFWWRAIRVVNLPELGEGELGSPHLTLAAQTVSADQLKPTFEQSAQRLISYFSPTKYGVPPDTPTTNHLLVDQLLSLERSSRIFGCLTV